MDIKSRFFKVKTEVDEENLKQKKNAKLIAVSKTKSAEDIRLVHQMGQIDFAENYVTELVSKISELNQTNIKWHFIGRLQTNKVDKIVGQVELIHSVDSLKLLEKINATAEKKSVYQNVLLQIKFGDESTKSGFGLAEVESICILSQKYKYINVCGFMTILPLNSTEEEKIIFYRCLRQELIKIKSVLDLKNLNELSMGMSDDFKLAISEGSTMIRVGSAIFGARQ